jgi:pimeloyl-ACP methyl ester carboxylesterase
MLFITGNVLPAPEVDSQKMDVPGLSRRRRGLCALTRSLQPLDFVSGVRRGIIVRLLVGEQDEVTPAELSQRYADVLQKRGMDAQVTVLPGLGHNIMFTQPVFAEIAGLVE